MKELIVIIFMLFSIQVKAQSEQQADSLTDQVYTYVDKMPEFPGGNDKIQVFLKKNIVYPPLARSKKIEGRVYIGFIVDKSGRIKDVSIKRSADPVLDAEAVRVVNKMPLWKPGIQNGTPVNVSLMMPVEFKLEN